MIAAAIFSSRPWDVTAPYDPTEDLLHSIAASGMGLAFAVGVCAVAISRYRRPGRRRVRVLDVLAIAASVLIPLGMVSYPGIAGLLQRMMFTIAYLWYALEVLLPPEVATGSPSATSTR
jgi:hypothetical protein